MHSLRHTRLIAFLLGRELWETRFPGSKDQLVTLLESRTHLAQKAREASGPPMVPGKKGFVSHFAGDILHVRHNPPFPLIPHTACYFRGVVEALGPRETRIAGWFGFWWPVLAFRFLLLAVTLFVLIYPIVGLLAGWFPMSLLDAVIVIMGFLVFASFSFLSTAVGVSVMARRATAHIKPLLSGASSQ